MCQLLSNELYSLLYLIGQISSHVLLVRLRTNSVCQLTVLSSFVIYPRPSRVHTTEECDSMSAAPSLSNQLAQLLPNCCTYLHGSLQARHQHQHNTPTLNDLPFLATMCSANTNAYQLGCRHQPIFTANRQQNLEHDYCTSRVVTAITAGRPFHPYRRLRPC